MVASTGLGPKAPGRWSSRVERDRDRAVVDELDLHACTENALLDRHAELSKRCGEVLVEGLGELRPRRMRERRSVSLRRVGDQRELADDESLAAGVQERAVELARLVLEDAQAGDLPRKPFRLLGRIAFCDAEEDEQTCADLTARRRTRAGDTLDDCSD
jgi:hypothetical protein